MARIDLNHIRHSYSAKPTGEADFALKEVNHSWDDGGAYALLGPSGCGKTTLLNIISGLLKPTEGSIHFDGKDVTPLAPEQRNIAQVFQFPVVYDTMTVFENLAFPLRNRGLPESDVRKRVDATLEMLGMTSISNRRARGFTADVKQKISLGRGVVRQDVNAILFDEPLTVIDPQMKWQLRSQLKSLHRQFGHTMIYVTHDQTEALTFADKVVVMFGGEIVQIGTPAELFERPSHTFVGYFIGSPGMNVIPAKIEGSKVHAAGMVIEMSAPLSAPAGANIELGIRPEFVTVGTKGQAAVIDKVEDIGRLKIVRARMDGNPIAAIVGEGKEIPAEPRISFDPKGVNIYAGSWRLEGRARP